MMTAAQSKLKQPEQEWLENMAKANGYHAPTRIGASQWAALCPLVFTVAIITGNLFADYGYEDRWCYASYEKAAVALALWIANDFKGEPQGWHRHPDSGRRRPDGDGTQEHINP